MKIGIFWCYANTVPGITEDISQGFIYMDKTVFESAIKQKIAEFFNINLNQVIWKKYPHYNTKQDELSCLFDD